MGDHPVIAALERNGYLYEDTAPECDSCGNELDGNAYEIDGLWVCKDCFREWLADYSETNPVSVAEKLLVNVKAIGVTDLI